MIHYEFPFIEKHTTLENLKAFSEMLVMAFARAKRDGVQVAGFSFREEGHVIYVGIKGEKIPGGKNTPG